MSWSPPRRCRARFHLVVLPSLFGVALLALAAAPALPSTQMLVGADARQILLPLKQFLADELAAGRLPRWYPYDGVGVSFPGSFIGGLLDPLNLLLLALRPSQALKWMTLLCLPMAALGLAYLARSVGLPRRAAAFSGVAYAVSGLALSQTSTLPYLASIARIPWALGAAIRLSRTPSLGRAAALSIGIASVVWGGDPEEAILVSLVVTLILVHHRPAWAFALFSAVLSAGLTLALILPGVHQAIGSTRHGALGAEEALSWSLHPARLLELALGSPFDADPLRPETVATFGGQNGGFWSASLYLGALVSLFAGVGFASRGGRTGLWRGLAGMCLLGAWLSLGRFGHLYAQLPVLMHFRYPEKLEVWVVIPLAVFAGRGWLRLQRPWPLKPSIVFVLLLVVASGLATAFCSLSFVGGLLRGLGILATAAAVHRLAPPSARRAALAALALLDPASSNGALIATGPESVWLSPTSPVPEVGQNERLCVDLRYGGYDLPAEHGGREGALAAERATADSGLSALYRIHSVGQQIPLQSSALASLCSVPDVCLDPCSRLLGARWLFAPHQAVARLLATGNYREARTLTLPHCSLLEDLLAAPYSAVLPALSYRDAWKTVVALHRGEVIPGNQALISAAVLPSGGPWTGHGEAVAQRPRPDLIELHTHADAPGILVVREGYSPDWSVSIDGVPATLLEADLGLLGVAVPAGSHVATFQFVPWGWPGMLAIFAVTLVLCLCLCWREVVD